MKPLHLGTFRMPEPAETYGYRMDGFDGDPKKQYKPWSEMTEQERHDDTIAAVEYWETNHRGATAE